MHKFNRPSGIFLRSFTSWLLAKRSKSLFSRRIIILSAAIILSIFGGRLLQSVITYALTQAFVQTDWSTGADTVNTINNSNLTGWTKYYSATYGTDISTPGQLKLKMEISTP